MREEGEREREGVVEGGVVMGGASGGAGCSSMVAMVVVWRGELYDEVGGEWGGSGDFRGFEECVGDCETV